MCHTNNEHRKTTNDGKNRTTKLRKNLDTRRKENLKILGNFASGHYAKMKEKKLKRIAQENEKSTLNQTT